MKVTDTWSGGRETVRGMYAKGSPAWKKISPDRHEHGHHDGALYNHAHKDGRVPHGHVYECRNDPHGGGRTAECAMPPISEMESNARR